MPFDVARHVAELRVAVDTYSDSRLTRALERVGYFSANERFALCKYLLLHNDGDKRKDFQIFSFLSFTHDYQFALDKQGRSLLHFAAKAGAIDALRYLLAVGLNPLLRDCTGVTPLLSAILAKQEPAIAVLAQGAAAEAALLQDDNIKGPPAVVGRVKELQRQHKAVILGKRPLVALPGGAMRPDAAQVMASAIYLEHLPHDGFLPERILYLYRYAHELRPLIDMVACGALDQPKSFKIICTSFAGLQKFIPQHVLGRAIHDEQRRSSHGVYSGIYRGKNSIFIGVDVVNVNMLAIIMHEAVHWAMLKVFQNKYLPYEPFDDANQSKMQVVIAQTRAKLEQFSRATELEQAAADAISNVFTMYTSDQYGVELIVKVAEIIALLGYSKGCRWLNANARELFDYYQQVVNPKIIQHLQDRRADDRFARQLPDEVDDDIYEPEVSECLALVDNPRGNLAGQAPSVIAAALMKAAAKSTDVLLTKLVLFPEAQTALHNMIKRENVFMSAVFAGSAACLSMLLNFYGADVMPTTQGRLLATAAGNPLDADGVMADLILKKYGSTIKIEDRVEAMVTAILEHKNTTWHMIAATLVEPLLPAQLRSIEQAVVRSGFMALEVDTPAASGAEHFNVIGLAG